MFPTATYIQRRQALSQHLQGGKILLLGNVDAAMNYAANTYHFRQDSTFLYFTGLNRAGLYAVIDLDQGTTTVYGNELTMDDIVWTGDLPTIAEQAAQAGISRVAAPSQLEADLAGAPIHYLPPYRGKQNLELQRLLGKSKAEVETGASLELIQAIVKLRAYKSAEEVEALETAVRITNEMHLAAMRTARPGMRESDVYAALMHAAYAENATASFPPIVTVNGQILHNHAHGNRMQAGDLLLVDCGAENHDLYVGDMTRAFPVSPTFSDRQKAVYEVCLQSQLDAIATLKPGVPYRDSHLAACRTIAAGMKDLGIMKGDVDEAVAAGAHALFFPHGLGHMMGMDVHDMENFGENNVGYDSEFQRSEQFGLAFLRLGRRLESGFVITVEPGIYFIPQLMDKWKAEGKFTEFINYEEATKYKDFGGIRIEDDYLITDEGARLLGHPVAKTVADVEAVRQS